MMSASTASVGVGGGRNKFPFTATQYQELEHQALIYKYMAAGIPIPSDLLFNIKRSLDSSLSSKLFPFQSSPLGWNPYQMGYGKKIDPEPGRCRRTDGKKWRCAKEAYPDSKYCERHMHRGKNRSRKPVESPLTPTTNNNTISSTPNNNNINININNNNSNSPISATSSSSTNLTHQSLFTNKNTSSSLYSSYPSSDSSYNSNNPHLLYPHSSSSSSSFPHKDYTRERYYQGLKEDQGSEHAFFTESTDSSIRGFSIDESSQLGEKHSVNFPNYLQPLQNTTNNLQQQDKQCYIWGRDFNCELSMKVEEERSNLNEKTTHHFFDDFPINNKNNGGRGGFRDDSSSTTQLSISIPSSTSNHHDFFRNL